MRTIALTLSLAIALCVALQARAEDAPTAAAAEPQQQLLDAGQLDQLVAPIALYPDPLLAQVLMASTYPLEIVQADRWAKANKSLKGDKLDSALAGQDWDASVKALVEAPSVLAMMNDDLDWTQALGDAMLAQQADLMDAIQRLRAKAQANGKLETTKEQKVTVTQEADQPVIVIEPASPETVYVPYYDPSVVYGTWDYPDYPPYYFPPAPGYLVGGAIATGIAWGAGLAIGNAIWDGFDWHRGDLRVDIDKNINIDRNININDVKVGKWEHNSAHRRGVNYTNQSVKNKFANANVRSGDRKLDFRGHDGKQVVKPPNIAGGGKLPDRKGDLGGGGGKPDLGKRDGGKPDLGKIEGQLKDKKPDLGKRDGNKPDLGKIEGQLKDKRPGKQAALPDKKADLGKRVERAKPKPNAFDARDGAKARDYSKRGHASLGDRGAGQFARPSGGGGKSVKRSGGQRVGGGGGGGRGGGGGGRGGGRRR